jgi:hypothetical protein
MFAELMLSADHPLWLAKLEKIEEMLRERLECARNQYDTDRKNPAHLHQYVETLKQFTEFTVDGKIPLEVEQRKFFTAAN